MQICLEGKFLNSTYICKTENLSPSHFFTNLLTISFYNIRASLFDKLYISTFDLLIHVLVVHTTGYVAPTKIAENCFFSWEEVKTLSSFSAQAILILVFLNFILTLCNCKTVCYVFENSILLPRFKYIFGFGSSD